MSLYPFALFLHIVAVLGLFIATGIEWTTLFGVRSAKNVAQVRQFMNVNTAFELVFPVAALLILVAGLYMTFTVWGWSQAWINVSLLALISMGILGPTINARRMKAIHISAELTPDGPVPASLKKQINNRVLWTTVQAMSFADLGIIYLMTIKPGWIESIVVIIVTATVGAIVAQRMLRNAHAAQPGIEAATAYTVLADTTPEADSAVAYSVLEEETAR